jgi:hypothetical protein
MIPGGTRRTGWFYQDYFAPGAISWKFGISLKFEASVTIGADVVVSGTWRVFWADVSTFQAKREILQEISRFFLAAPF